MFTGSNELTPTRQDGAKKDLWHVTRTIDFDKCSEIVALHVRSILRYYYLYYHKCLYYLKVSLKFSLFHIKDSHFYPN